MNNTDIKNNELTSKVPHFPSHIHTSSFYFSLFVLYFPCMRARGSYHFDMSNSVTCAIRIVWHEIHCFMVALLLFGTVKWLIICNIRGNGFCTLPAPLRTSPSQCLMFSWCVQMWVYIHKMCIYDRLAENDAICSGLERWNKHRICFVSFAAGPEASSAIFERRSVIILSYPKTGAVGTIK
jgi:hypothetical protein